MATNANGLTLFRDYKMKITRWGLFKYCCMSQIKSVKKVDTTSKQNASNPISFFVVCISDEIIKQQHCLFGTLAP